MKSHDPQSEQAWQALGKASRVTPTPDFTRRVLEAARTEPQEKIARVLPFLRLAAPLAAAAVLALSTAIHLLQPQTPTTIAPSPQASLDDLARMQMALSCLPEDPEADTSDPEALLSLVEIEDPSDLRDEQLYALLF